MPREITDLIIQDVPILRSDDRVREAVAQVLEARLPALPVAGNDGRFAGVFGEREFMIALFPGYVGNLSTASFVRRSMDSVLEKRGGCALERVEQHMTTDHVEVSEQFSDVEIAEVFLHHRVLIAPVVSKTGIVGVVTRSDFFRALAERFLDA